MPVPPRLITRGMLLAASLLTAASPGCRRQPPAPAPTGTQAPAASATPAAAPAAPAPAAALPEPAAGGYDPVKLLDAGKSAAEVYTGEARDPGWADPVEQLLRARIGGDLERELGQAGAAVKCKQLSCLIGVDAPADKREQALAISKLVTLGPVTVDIEPEEDGTLRWLFFSEPRMSRGEVFVAWYLNARKRALDQIRDDKRPSPFRGQLPPE
jgi:hypothetical protein